MSESSGSPEERPDENELRQHAENGDEARADPNDRTDDLRAHSQDPAEG